MTLQSVYFNLRGIIFESDNAVTMPDGKKYDGVKKIFKISTTHPAGIMINGNMEFENIPIENLIEEFIQTKNPEKLKTITDMKNSFIATLKENSEKSTLDEYLTPILDEFKYELTNEIIHNGFEKTVDSKKRTPIKEYLRTYSHFEYEFEDLLPEDKKEYNEVVWEIFSHELRYEGTGIILAGFDLKSSKPSFIELNIHCNDNGKIIYDEVESAINTKEPKFKLFAMNNEGYTFITGVNEEFIEYINQYIDESSENIINNLSDDLEMENIENRDNLLNLIKNELKNEFSKLTKDIEEYRLDVINDTTESIEYLPRRLICEFLDTINQLTVMKQQTSSELETVSKGTHICLMTKHDGFKWIKFDEEIL